MKNKTNRTTLAARRRKIKKNIISKRPLHKKILLHPTTIFFLLCVGVFLVGMTIKILATTVTASIAITAPVPTQEATITQPLNQTHFTSGPINVTGTCPDDTYVKLYRNDIFSGVNICSDNTYQIITDLSVGSNILIARVYNLQDIEGPVSVQTIVYLDQQVNPQIPSATTLQMLTLEGTAHNPNVIKQVSSYPKIFGVAPPFSHIIVTINSNPIICETDADAQGSWVCQFSKVVPNGNHTVDIEARTPSGEIIKVTGFRIIVILAIDASRQQIGSALAPLISSDFQYRAYDSGEAISWNIIFVGGAPPYAIHVNWGDGQESNYVQQDQSSFSITHIYYVEHRINFIVKVEATDADGSTAFMQLAAVSGQGLPVAEDNSVLAFLDSNNLLRFIWPSYIIVVLMTVSFYLGERREYQDIFRRRKLRRRTS